MFVWLTFGFATLANAQNADWQLLADETFPVSEHHLWTSELPDIEVDAAGTVWIGFTTRYDTDRYATSGIAHRTEDGWEVQRDLFEGAGATALALDQGHIVAFGTQHSGTTQVKQRGLNGWDDLPTINGSVRSGVSANVAWGVTDGKWAQFTRNEDRWSVRSLDIYDTNNGHPERFLAEGPVFYTQFDGNWQGYFLQTLTGQRALIETSDSHYVRAREHDGTLHVAAQRRIGGGRSVDPIVLYTGESDRVGQSTDGYSAAPPECPLEEGRCVTPATKRTLIGLVPSGLTVVLEEEVVATWGRQCTSLAPPDPRYIGADTPGVRLCLEYGDWGIAPSLGETTAMRLVLDGQPVPMNNAPFTDEIATAFHNGVVHLTWYEEVGSGVQVRYLAVSR